MPWTRGPAAGAMAQAAAPKLGFLFSGQGTQYPGMAAGLYRDAPAFRAASDRCADLVSPLLDRCRIWCSRPAAMRSTLKPD